MKRTGGSQRCHRTQAPEVRHIQCREITAELKWFSDLIIVPNLMPDLNSTLLNG